MSPVRTSTRPTIGWREWVALPEWGVDWTKAKIDTGARTSALHAFDLEGFERDGIDWVRFTVHPWQRSAGDEVVVESPMVAAKQVRSSSGATSLRPVVHTTIQLAGVSFQTEITLTRRDEMGFRMLVGRQALRKRFLVDSARSYAGGKPSIDTRRRNREP